MVQRNYANALLTLDKQKYADRARSQLEVTIRLEPEDASETLELERAKWDWLTLK